MDKQQYEYCLGAADALDSMEGLEAEVSYRRFLGGYSHEQIASELQIPVAKAQEIAAGGLMKMHQSVFGPK